MIVSKRQSHLAIETIISCPWRQRTSCPFGLNGPFVGFKWKGSLHYKQRDETEKPKDNTACCEANKCDTFYDAPDECDKARRGDKQETAGAVEKHAMGWFVFVHAKKVFLRARQTYRTTFEVYT